MEEQHLTKASERLHMSQPAVSSALKRLRERIGDELFVRTTRGLKPTPRANQLYLEIQPALQMIEQGWQGEEFKPEQSSRSFTISCNGAVEYLALPWLNAHLRAAAPNVLLTVAPDHLPDISERLQDGRLDMAIDFVHYSHPGLVSTPLQEPELAVIAATSHPDFSSPLSLEQFQTLKHVSITPRNQQGTPIEQLMGHKNLGRQVQLCVSNFVSIPEIVANSDLIAVVPKALAQQPQLEGRIQLSELPFTAPKVPMQLIWHKSREHDAAHVWLRQVLLSMPPI